MGDWKQHLLKSSLPLESMVAEVQRCDQYVCSNSNRMYAARSVREAAGPATR